MKSTPAIVLCALLAACGGGGGYGSSSPVTNASPGGIWTGTDSISGLQVFGVVDESGEAHFLRSDNVQYAGTATTTGNSISATFDGFTPLGFVFPDGSTHGTGTLTGTIQERVSISSTTQFKTDAGNISNGTLNLAFSSVYNQASALATVAGNYTDPSSGTVITVDGTGSVFAQDATNGCVLAGQVSIINASYNAYRVVGAFANCTGTAAALNGVQFSGLGTLDNTTNPERLDIGVTGQSGSTKYALTYFLNHS